MVNVLKVYILLERTQQQKVQEEISSFVRMYYFKFSQSYLFFLYISVKQYYTCSVVLLQQFNKQEVDVE